MFALSTWFDALVLFLLTSGGWVFVSLAAATYVLGFMKRFPWFLAALLILAFSLAGGNMIGHSEGTAKERKHWEDLVRVEREAREADRRRAAQALADKALEYQTRENNILRRQTIELTTLQAAIKAERERMENQDEPEPIIIDNTKTCPPRPRVRSCLIQHVPSGVLQSIK